MKQVFFFIPNNIASLRTSFNQLLHSVLDGIEGFTQSLDHETIEYKIEIVKIDIFKIIIIISYKYQNYGK